MPAVGLDRVAGDWSLEPQLIAGAALGIALWVLGARRLRARGRADLAPLWRGALVAAGLALAVLAVSSPLDEAGERYLLSAHMLQHLVLADVAPLLVVLGVSGPLSRFVVPVPVLRAGARSRPVRRALGALFSPLGAILLWCGAMALWHTPAAWGAALRHPLVHDLEHASLFAAGVVAWAVILDPARRRSPSAGRRAAVAAALLLAGMVLGEVLVTAAPLYGAYSHVADRMFGWSPSEDQRRAGLLMMAEGTLTMGIAAAFLLASHTRRVAESLAPGDGAEDAER
jgi:cytochrome c oxidase assembly factor CtaG